MKLTIRIVAALMACASWLSVDVGASRAAGSAVGPNVQAPENAAPGDRISVVVSGFDGPSVTIPVCGNEARRGSSDCDLPASTAVSVSGGAPAQTPFFITSPPTTCPCVIRASNGDQSAVTAIRILGHPLGPVEGAPPLQQAVEVEVTATRSSTSATARLRAGLGGPVAYDLRVRLTNVSGVALTNIALVGSVGEPGSENPENISIPRPEVLGGAETYEVTVQHEVPALTWGTVEWTVSVVGAGPPVVASTTTSTSPTLLVYAMILLLLLLFLIPLRHVVARHDMKRRQRELDELIEAGRGRELVDI